MWHAVLLSITVTFTEINTILPTMIIRVGGSELHIGVMTAIMIGVPLAAQLLFAGYLHSRRMKKPFLLLGINLRAAALVLIAFTLLNIAGFSFQAALLLIYGELLVFTISGAFASVSYVDIVGKSFSGDMRKRFFINKQIASGGGILISALAAREVLKRLEYPVNFFSLFLAAGIVLLIASIGFYVIREKPAARVGRHPSFRDTLRSIPSLIKSDSNLRNYIIIVNLLGFGIVLLPFYISFARQQYSLDPGMVGNLLLLQILGMIASGFLWKYLVKRRGFKGILFSLALIGSVLPWLVFVFGTYFPFGVYLFIFLLSGSGLSAQKITVEAVLVEISTDENRALYSGIIGTFNITIAVFPILIGALLSVVGYLPLFSAAGILAVASFLFIRKLVCPIDTADN